MENDLTFIRYKSIEYIAYENDLTFIRYKSIEYIAYENDLIFICKGESFQLLAFSSNWCLIVYFTKQNK